FNKLAMGALGCQLAVSLMVITPKSNRGCSLLVSRHANKFLTGRTLLTGPLTDKALVIRLIKGE
ncbi:MAG: hypothetical protein ACTH8A_12445, partial [Serratia proteamaculans]